MKPQLDKLSQLPAGRVQICQAQIIDPANDKEFRGGVMIENGRILEVDPKLYEPQQENCVWGGDFMLAPGLIDLKVAMPALTDKKTNLKEQQNLAASAIAGGVTLMALVGETSPRAGIIANAPACITQDGQARLNDIGILSEQGVRLFIADQPIANARLLADYLAYGRDFDACLLLGAEEPQLVDKGLVNDGKQASLFGLATRPAYAESVQVARDLQIQAKMGGKIIFGPISYAPALRQVLKTEAWGAIALHSLLFDETELEIDSPLALTKPPLRSRKEVTELMGAFSKHSNLCIMSNHSARSRDELRHPLMHAQFGINSIGYFLPALIDISCRSELTLAQCLAFATSRPAKLLGLKQGYMAKGAPADLILFDPKAKTPISKTQKSLFEKAKLTGKTLSVISQGKILKGEILKTEAAQT